MRKLSGIIVSDKMEKTIVVQVERLKLNKVYKKRRKVSKKYKVNNPDNKYKIGQRVVIGESRPISKTKCWEVVELVA